jgi:hypothetical protein
MVNGGGFMAAHDESHGQILYELKLFDVWRFTVGKPDSRSLAHHRLNQGLVGDEERLLIVAPSRATNSLQKVEALGTLGDNGKDVIAKGKLGVEDNAQNLWILVQGNLDIVDGDLRVSPVLFTPRGEEGDLRLRWGNAEFLPDSPINDGCQASLKFPVEWGKVWVRLHHSEVVRIGFQDVSDCRAIADEKIE